jgi:hypothetical protein
MKHLKIYENFFNDPIFNEVIEWLNKNYGNLKKVKEKRDSLGTEIEEYIYLDDSMDLVMSLQLNMKSLGTTRNSNVIHVSSDIWNALYNKFFLNEKEATSVLEKWLVDAYGIWGVKVLWMF